MVINRKTHNPILDISVCRHAYFISPGLFGYRHGFIHRGFPRKKEVEKLNKEIKGLLRENRS